VSTCYLDVDDEITIAIKRLRAITDGEALLVIPPGSRIATSRINFRLLAREATERRLNIAAVSDEPGVRALAISAGLPAYDSVATAEAALKAFREQDRQLAERIGQGPRGRAVPPATRNVTDTAVMPQPLMGASDAAARQTSDEDVAESTSVMPKPDKGGRRRRPRRSRVLPLVVLLLVGVLVAGVAYGAYVFLPTATITLRPNVTRLASPVYTITADPTVAVADQATGVVGAQRLDLPISASGQFPATGVDVSLTTAHGTVRFRSTNTLNAVSVPAGTIVSTSDNIEFKTTDAVVVPRADFSSGTAGKVEVHVEASIDGPRGNVPAGAITEVPQSLTQQLVTVTNPDPTDGGQRNEQAVVTQTDYDTAMTTLGEQLTAASSNAVTDPANIPKGLTAYAATAVMATTVADPTADGAVGTAEDTFTLTLSSSVSVIAVNESLVNDLGESRFRSSLPADEQIVADTVYTSHAPGSVNGQTIVYQVTASADVYMQPNEQQVLSAVSGKSVAEARQALAQYGEVNIQMWPGFIDHLPDQAARIRLSVVPPSPSP
jgi:Baseplate J-like protein